MQYTYALDIQLNQVCKKIREQYAASVLPVIMVSAKSQEGDVVKGLKAGANDYLTKVSD